VQYHPPVDPLSATVACLEKLQTLNRAITSPPVLHSGRFCRCWVMAKRKRNKPRKKAGRKRLPTSSRLEADATEVVADIVHTIEEKKFGTKLAKRNNSRTTENES
jgi:hypothetical protein